MKEDPDKAKRMRSKGQEAEEESPASPVTDVSPRLVQLDEMPTGFHVPSTPHLFLLFVRLSSQLSLVPAHHKVRGTAGLCHCDRWDAAHVPAGGPELASVFLGSGHRHHPG